MKIQVAGDEWEIQVKLEWNAEIPRDEVAEVVLESGKTRITAPVIPPFLTIREIGDHGWFDGDSSKWPDANRIPDWMLGSSNGSPRAKVWLGWSEEGPWGGRWRSRTRRFTSPTYARSSGAIRWKISSIVGIRGFSERTDTGYRMEFLVPWSKIQGAAPKAGALWGFNLNLRVKGTDGDRDVYSPRPPGAELSDHPHRWSTVELVR